MAVVQLLEGQNGAWGKNGVASKHLTFHARLADSHRLVAVVRKHRKGRIKKEEGWKEEERATKAAEIGT